MALVQQANGTQTATINTEHSLSTRTDGKTYVLLVDLNNMVAGDILELRIKVKVLSGSTARVYTLATYVGAQPEPNIISVPVPAVHSVEFTLKQTAGTGRNFDWSVVSID